MKFFCTYSLALFIPLSALAQEPKLPLRSGTYLFKHRYAEQPAMESFNVRVTLYGNTISVSTLRASPPFPKGVIAAGKLVWNAHAGAWIVATEDADKFTQEVGGCSGGPEIIDLKRKIYWTC